MLFDTGLDPKITSDPTYVSSAIGRFFMRRVFRFHIEKSDALEYQLQRLGYGAADVVKVVISHLHFDNIGNIAAVPQALLIVARDEWHQLANPHPERDYFFREHIEIPSSNWQPFDFNPTDDPLFTPFGGCYDLMGDGTLTLLPTPGHTAGSLSMLIYDKDRPPVLLVGDLTYDVEMLMNDQLPGICNDKSALRRSFANVRRLKEQLPDLVILSGHDPAASQTLHDLYTSTTQNGEFQ